MKRDKSKQGFIDSDILELVKLLNSKGYETSSSCSGRIVLLDVKTFGQKKNSRWLYKTHKKAKFRDVIKVLRNKRVYFLQEPMILHLKAKKLKDAEKILMIANLAGLKHSGVVNLKSLRVEIRGNERIETVLKDNKEEYIRLLVNEANKKLMKTKEKIKKFYNLVKKLM